MQFCPHCMKPATGTVCGNCGGNMNWKAPASQLPLGTQLRGRSGDLYSIGAAKGQGGFGITYAAMDMMKGHRVAIKEYFPSRCASRGQNYRVVPQSGQEQIYLGGMKSFLDEASMLSKVSFLESVVRVKESFEANGTAYLVMEYVDGTPLHEVLQRGGPMKASELMPKLPKLLRDLETMHKARVIHRDISPDNIILMPDGDLKLLDFGSARSVQDGKSMTVMLKQGFSPVEQYQSKGQDAYTDVYALAATIYYCLTGVVPPSAVNRLDKDTLVPPNQAGAGLPPAQERALMDGMIVQPKLRPQSMAAFAHKLFPEYFPSNGTDVFAPPVPDPGIPLPAGVPANPPGGNGTRSGSSRIPEDKVPLVIGLAVVGAVLSLAFLVLGIVLIANL